MKNEISHYLNTVTRDSDRGRKKKIPLKVLLIPKMHKLRTLSSITTHIFITTDMALKTVLVRFLFAFEEFPLFPQAKRVCRKDRIKEGGATLFFLSLYIPPLYHLSSFKFICQLLFLRDAMKVIFLPF